MFELLTDYQATNIFVQSPLSEFKLLSSLNKQLFNLVYNSFYSESIFQERSQIEFDNELLEYREDSGEAMKWKDFYQRMIWYKKNIIKEDYKCKIVTDIKTRRWIDILTDFVKFILDLVQNNKLMELKMLYQTIDNKRKFKKYIAEFAGKYNKLDIINWLIKLPLNNSIELLDLQETILVYAVCYEHNNLAKELYAKGFEITENVVQNSSFAGNIEMLDWFYSLNSSLVPNEFASYMAIVTKDFKTLIWLYEHGVQLPEITSRCYETLAKNNGLEIFKWFFERGIRPTLALLNRAIEHKNDNLADWMRDKVVQ